METPILWRVEGGVAGQKWASKEHIGQAHPIQHLEGFFMEPAQNV